MLGNKIENIPDGWTVANVEDIADIKTGTGDTQDREEGGKYPFYVRSNTIERVNHYSFDGEGVLTSGDGVGVGKIYHYVNGKIHYHQRVYNIHNFKKNILGKYFYEFFKHNFYNRVMRMSAKGSVDSVRLEMISKMSVLIPPVNEQQKIADLLASINRKIELFDKKINQTTDLRRGLIQKLLSKGVGEKDKDGRWLSHKEFITSSIGIKPKLWKSSKLEDISSFITKGATPTTYGFDWSDKETGIPFLRSECVGESGFKSSGLKYISQDAHAAMQRSQIYAGDILISITGNIGRVVKLPDDIPEANINQHIAKVSINAEHNSDFINYSLQSKEYIKLYDRIFTGQAYPQLSLKQVRENPIYLPPKEEQDKIAEILLAVDKKISCLILQKNENQQLKKGLMQKLLTGEWRINLDNAEKKQLVKAV